MFTNRKDGGEKLAKALSDYQFEHPLVIGIPRGGVETAYYVAKRLHADLSLIITRKLGYPSQPEAAFGAIAEDGSYFLFDDAIKSLSPEEIQKVVLKEKQEIKRRIKILRQGKPLPVIQGRTIILVDDGIATGATLFATIELCKKQHAKKIIVASPVASARMEKLLLQKADDVMILYTPPMFHAVSQGYQSFNNLSDEEVLKIMKQRETEVMLVNVKT